MAVARRGPARALQARAVSLPVLRADGLAAGEVGRALRDSGGFLIAVRGSRSLRAGGGGGPRLLRAARGTPSSPYVNGDHDAETPSAHSLRIFAALHEPKRLILVPDCGHDDASTPEVWRDLDGWLETVMSAGARALSEGKKPVSDDSSESWKLELRYGRRVTPFSHYTASAEGVVVYETEPVQPPGDKPRGYDIRFTPFDSDEAS